MSDKTKNVVVVIIFVLFLVMMMLLNIIKTDTEISLSERRKLAKFPEITVQKILDGSFSKEFEKYATDQIIKREGFRKTKANIEMKVLRKKDNNHIYQYKNSIIKMEYPLNEKSVQNAASKINQLQQEYFRQNKCYYTIVPDKNYFVSSNEYIRLDYEKLQEMMQKNITNMEYINLFECLQLEDYYVTDIHWKQENLSKVVEKLSKQMNFTVNNIYTKNEIIEFNGLYAGQLPVKTKQDKICTLTNQTVENATVYHYENGKQTKVYDEEKLNSNDKYDIYLSGPTPMITIENKEAKTNKELIIFRDSFASSLAPLLIEGYSKITLIDIRYMRSKDIEKYVKIENQEVLFLYSTLVLNNSSILK